MAGGARKGAGRPKGSPTLIKKDFAVDLLNKLNYEEQWESLLEPRKTLVRGRGDEGDTTELLPPDPKIQLEVLKYLTDRAFGKAPQAVLIGGDGGKPVEIKFLGRPPAWAERAQEAVAKLNQATEAVKRASVKIKDR